jgi:hypothetical protein|eukprot:COSAG06_NODE_203_length_20332_cov_14.679978_5_plen_563_part_00
MAAVSMAAQYGDTRAQPQHDTLFSPSRSERSGGGSSRLHYGSGSELHYGSGSGLHGSRSMPDVLPSGRDYPSARSERRASHGRRRSRKQGSQQQDPRLTEIAHDHTDPLHNRESQPRPADPKPKFVAKGLLNLDNLQVKKSKTQPDWAKWESNEGREGWISQPRFKTRSQMKKYHADSHMPDPSFDVDGDGQVSAEDLKVAAKYDVNLDGQLQPDELRKLRLGIVSEALGNINRRLKSGQMYAHNPAVVQAVQGFASVGDAVDHPDFPRKLERLRACMNPSFEGRSSLNVREIMRQPRASDERHPERVPATPHYLQQAQLSAAKAAHAAQDSSTPDGPTPRWMAQRSALQDSVQAEKDDMSQCESDLDTVQQLSPHTSGYKTKSELYGARKQEITRLATHYLDYENFGGDYHFPNAQREVEKKKNMLAEEEQRHYTEAGSARSSGGGGGARRTASFDPALGPSSPSRGKSIYQQQMQQQQQQSGGGNSSSKPRARARVQGCGTHLKIFTEPEADPLVPGAKAGRDGPIFQGGRLPTPLYDSISVATFAKPLEGQRTPGGRKL